jgi:hypothetical protein
MYVIFVGTRQVGPRPRRSGSVLGEVEQHFHFRDRHGFLAGVRGQKPRFPAYAGVAPNPGGRRTGLNTTRSLSVKRLPAIGFRPFAGGSSAA